VKIDLGWQLLGELVGVDMNEWKLMLLA